MRGLHLTADLHRCLCEPSRMADAAGMEGHGEWLAAACGLTVVSRMVHAFPATHEGPGGVTATFLLAESHMCLHTWPEQRAVTLDVYVCNSAEDKSAAARKAMESWIDFFAPEQIERHELRRGSIR